METSSIIRRSSIVEKEFHLLGEGNSIMEADGNRLLLREGSSAMEKRQLL